MRVAIAYCGSPTLTKWLVLFATFTCAFIPGRLDEANLDHFPKELHWLSRLERFIALLMSFIFGRYQV